MSGRDKGLEAIARRLEIAREFEKKGNRESALDAYRDVLSRLDPESDLKKEIKVIVEHLEDHSQSVIQRPAQKRPVPLSWMVAAAFLAGLLLMTGIVFLLGKRSSSPSATEVPLTRPAADNVLPNPTVTPDLSGPTQNGSSSETSLPTQSTIYLTVKSNVAYLRAGPHTNHRELLRIRRGTQLEIVGKYATNDGLWFYVQSSEGKEGWLLERWVTINSGKIDLIPTIPQAQIPTIPVKPTPYP